MHPSAVERLMGLPTKRPLLLEQPPKAAADITAAH